MKRREFIKHSFLTSLIFVSFNTKTQATTIFDTITVLQDDLFPEIKDFGISTKTISAKNYLIFVLAHKKVSDSDKKFIKDGIKWLNEEALKLHNKLYTKLTDKQREEVLNSISKQSWGESFIEAMLKYIFEALLGDPIYGINKDEVGWKWLEHKAGLPRPLEIYRG